MATHSSSLLPFALFLITALAISAADAGHSLFTLGTVPATKGQCGGSTAECLVEEELEITSSGISRRVLATSQYISYRSLRGNSIPCSRRGASYYNCLPGAQANPYTRSCIAMSQCRH